MKGLRGWLVRGFVWLLLGWLLLEGLAWLTLRGTTTESIAVPEDHLMPFDPETLWRLQPHSSFTDDGIVYDIDAFGMRASSTQTEGESILFVGDSSTFGIGVDTADTLPEQSARCSGLKPLNGGVSGYSTMQIAAQLPMRMERFRPKWVVLVVPWSDWMRTSTTDAERIRRAQYVFNVRRMMDESVLRHSFVIRWFNARARRRINANPIELDPDSILRPGRGTTKRRVTAVQHLENMQRIAGVVDRYQSRLIMVRLPTNRLFPVPSDSVIASYVDPVREWGRDRDIPFIEGDELLEQEPVATRIDWFVDPIHPSAKGHAFLAKAVCEAIRK